MSSIEPWLFDSLSLQHLASVGTVQWVWNRSKSGDEVKKINDTIGSFSRFAGLCILSVYRSIKHQEVAMEINRLILLVTKKSESFIEKLTLPGIVRDQLYIYLWEMHEKAIHWLKNTLSYMEEKVDPNKNDKISYFANNLVWNNIGCIDGRKMIESYVSNKETIDYYTWDQLCFYCSENYIRKFSDTLNWNVGKLDSRWTTVYWYFRNNGKFPTCDMFISPSEFSEFSEKYTFPDVYCMQITLNQVCEILIHNLPAFKYFWNKLPDTEKMQLNINESALVAADADIVVYLFGRIECNNLLSSEPARTRAGRMQNLLNMKLLCWPWVLFVDSWVYRYHDVDENGFKFFYLKSLIEQMREDQNREGFRELTKRQMRVHPHAKYHIVCEKVWAVCIEKFRQMDEILAKFLGIILLSEDVLLCKVVMKETTSYWRRIYLKGIKQWGEDFDGLGLNRNFCEEFKKQILINDSERVIFQGTVHQIQGEIARRLSRSDDEWI